MSDTLRLTLLQTDIAWEDKTHNLHCLHQHLQQLKGTTEVVVLPEMFTTGFSMQPQSLAETMDGPTWQQLQREAEESGITLVGSMIATDGESCFNRGFVVTPQGQCHLADKRHLFSIGGESRNYTAGNSRTLIPLHGWNVRLLVCYDLRFPVWSRNDSGSCDLLIYVANWPSSRRKVWDVLLQARALENQCYVCGVNRIGKDANGLCYNGGSVIYSPKGNLMASVPDDVEGSSTALLSLASLQEFRQKFPVARDADSYRIIL